jgi:cobalt-zinc-cadmium efflux system protein
VSAGHSHQPPAPSTGADRRRLAVALALIVAFMAVEVVAGILASSLALLSDAAHMLTDALALGLALAAAALAGRPARGPFTFGLRRAEILSAQANGALLFGLGLLISYQGIDRLISPSRVDGTTVLVVALAGVAVNLAAARALAGGGPARPAAGGASRPADPPSPRRSLNVEGALAHVVSDLAAFIATALAGLLILAAGWLRADGAAALVVAAIMLWGAWNLLRRSGRVLMEGSPEGVDPRQLGEALAAHPGVVEVHDLHVWELTTNFPALSAHVVVAPGGDCHAIRVELDALLAARFHITHTTLQVEHEHSELLQIE